MRGSLALLAASILAVAGAGCTGAPVAKQDNSTPAPDGSSGPPESHSDVTGDKDFCAAKAGCKFWDDDLHEYVVYKVDTPDLDVLIVPPASPFATDELPVIQQAAKAWADGINRTAADWMRKGFHMHIYTLGVDVPPAEALRDPEIIIVAAEFNPALLFGIGLEPKQVACESLGQSALLVYPTHAHDGMEIQAADCTGVGFLCIAFNTNFLAGGNVYMQDLVAHELGHCLGGGHVGDALDFSAKTVPIHDIMSYQHDAKQVHCVSSLNVRTLEGVYAVLLGQPSTSYLGPGSFYSMPVSEYSQVPCPTPA